MPRHGRPSSPPGSGPTRSRGDGPTRERPRARHRRRWWWRGRGRAESGEAGQLDVRQYPDDEGDDTEDQDGDGEDSFDRHAGSVARSPRAPRVLTAPGSGPETASPPPARVRGRSNQPREDGTEPGAVAGGFLRVAGTGGPEWTILGPVEPTDPRRATAGDAGGRPPAMSQWAGRDLNPQPTDYESAALTD